MSQLSPVAQIEEWLVSGDHGRAKEACLDLLAEHPADSDLRVLLALCDEAAGDPAAALTQLRQVRQSNPEHIRTLFHFGRLSLLLGDVQEARDALDTCVALSPNHAPTRHLLARLDHRAGSRDQAIEGLKVALRADKDYIPALCDLAILLVESGQIDEAHRHASHAVKLDAGEAGVQLAMGIVFEAQNHLSFAEQCLVNATDQDPNGFQGLMALARVYQKQGKHEEALRALDRLSEEQKLEPVAGYARAFSLVRLGQLQLGKGLYEHLIDQRPDNKTVLELLDLYIQTNDAKGLTDLPGRLDPETPEIVWADRFVKARLAEFSGKLDEAIELLSILVDTDDLDHEIRARLLLARLHLKKGETRACIDLITRLVERPALHYRVRWEIAQLAEQANDPALALRVVDAILVNRTLSHEIQGRTATMRLHLLDRMGKFEDARALLNDDKTPLGWLPVPQPMMLTDLPALDGSEFVASTESYAVPEVVWVPGWPWAGRELLLAALAQIEGAKVLSLAEGLTRHQHLGMVPGQPYHLRLDPEQIPPMRKRYLRAAEGAAVVIEPFPCKAAELIRMHQVFPSAKAIRVVCEPNYLRLQWHLAGYRDVEKMLEAWKREQHALDQLAAQEQVPILRVSLASLLDPNETAQAIDELMQALGHRSQPKMAQHIQALIQRHSYRSATHWNHYF